MGFVDETVEKLKKQAEGPCTCATAKPNKPCLSCMAKHDLDILKKGRLTQS